jgi:regulator of sigma E protease
MSSILLRNGKKIADFNKMNMELRLLDGCTMQVMREGRPIDIVIPEGTTDSLLSKDIKSYFTPGIPTIVDSVELLSNAQKGGLLKGDKVIGVNGKLIPIYQDLSKEIRANKNKDITLAVVRNKDTLSLPMKVNDKGMIGFRPDFKLEHFFNALASQKQIVQDGLFI